MNINFKYLLIVQSRGIDSHAILLSSVFSLAILDLKEQSKNYVPAKIWSPPKIVWSISYVTLNLTSGLFFLTAPNTFTFCYSLNSTAEIIFISSYLFKILQ
jgi:hypothetical protein